MIIINSFEHFENKSLLFEFIEFKIEICIVNDLVELKYIWKIKYPCNKPKDNFSFWGICIFDIPSVFNISM